MLSGKVFYHGTTKKAISAFGTLFNNVNIQKFNEDGTVAHTKKVPVSYGPKEKFLARLDQQPDLDIAQVSIQLPRLSFEITSFKYDAQRKQNANMLNKAMVGGKAARQYTPVPYNLTLNLYAIAKTQDESLQIMEQIVPMFGPTYTLTLKLPEMETTMDIPIILEDIQQQDNYDEKYEARREIVWTFTFTLQLSYSGPVDTSERGLIKQTEVSFYQNKDMTGLLGSTTATVNPFDANADGTYTILETIEGFE